MKRLLLYLLFLFLPTAILAQGPNAGFINVTDPPVIVASGTYNVTTGVVTRASGTQVFPTWIADGRLLINGSIYTVNTRDSDTQVTLDDTSLTGVSGATVSFGPDAAIPWDNVDDSPALNALATFLEEDPNQRGVVYFPGSAVTNNPVTESNDGYRLNSLVTFRRWRGMRIHGMGLGNNNGSQAPARLSWAGAGAGPMIAFEDCSGLVLDGLTFDGDSVAGAGDPITTLVRVSNENDPGTNATFNIAIRNCHFYDAPTLIQLESNVSGTIGNANYLWSNCLFEGQHDGSNKTQYAVRNMHNQGLMHTFIQCEWRNCNICIELVEGGRFQIYGGGLGSCWQFLRRQTGSTNTAGISVRDLFVNNGGAPRTILYESMQAGTGRYWGPISFENLQFGQTWPTVNFEEVSSYTGNTLTLQAANQLDVRPGDEIAFYDVNDLNTRLAITTVSSRASTQTYTLAQTAAQLGITVNANLRAAHGTPLFKLTGAERLDVEDCWWNTASVQGKRLCRLQTGSYSTIVQPLARFIMNTGLAATSASQLASRYLDINTSAGGTAYYRFEDCDDVITTTQPFSLTNIPGESGGGGGGDTHPIVDSTAIVKDETDATKLVRVDAGNVGTGSTRVLFMPNSDVDLKKNNYAATGSPGVGNDDTQGYDIGSLWLDTVGQKSYMCMSATTGAAVWKELTVAAAGGGTLPVDDTTSLVRDPVDTTKQVRIDAGTVDTATTVTISMPNSDISLLKTNVTTTDPGGTDDSSQNYAVGSQWFNTSSQKAFVCLDASTGAAVWLETTVSAATATNAPDQTTTTDPTADDDTSQGYQIGSRWVNTATQHEWVCLDATEGAARWRNTTRVNPISN